MDAPFINSSKKFHLLLKSEVKRMPTYSSDIVGIVKIKNGEQGVDGQSINWKGDYNSTVEYKYMDAVNYEGNSYIFVSSTPATGAIPGVDEEWELMVKKGEDGAPGKNGLTYKLITNQEKILKFYESLDDDIRVSFSPKQFIFNVLKQNEETDIDLKYYISPTATQSNEFSLKIEIDDNTGNWITLFNDKYKSGSTVSVFNCLGETFSATTVNNKTTFILDIDKAYAAGIIEDVLTDSDKAWNDFINILKTGSATLLISIYSISGAQLILSVPFSIDYGMRDEMARFQLNATGINAAIQNTKLTFDANGLTVRNGGIKIQNKDGENVLFSDTDGNLSLKGIIEATGGSFIGTVIATDGVFNGTINANSGFLNNVSVSGIVRIGDIVLDGRQLIDNAENPRKGIYSLSYYTTGEDESNSIPSGDGFKISVDGSIIANRIEIGEFATIKKFLQVGDSCWINNPEANTSYGNNFLYIKKDLIGDNEVTTVPAFRITKDGQLFLGKDNDGVIIDGLSETIHSGNYIQGSKGWSINPKNAEFNNVTVRGSIKASVLEYGEVQAIGGILMVRPSSIIKSYTQNGNSCTITLEDATWIKAGDYCQIRYGGMSGVILTIHVTNVSGNVISFTNSTTLTDDILSLPLVSYLNFTNNIITNNIGISINSTQNDSFAVPQAISIFQSTLSNNEIVRTPVVILGQMPTSDVVPEGFRGSYGLFADNAYLRGSLIAEGTKNGSSFSAGINTKSGIQMPNTDIPSSAVIGDIILWAGAPGTSNSDIQKARFRVDTQGNLYANSGFFNGTIITNSTISASEITTAVLKGLGAKKEDGAVAALTIQDAYTGIDFKVGNATKMKLTAEGLQLNVPLTLNQELSLDGTRFTSPIIMVNDPSGAYGVGDSKATAVIEPNSFSFYQNGIPTNDKNISYSGTFRYNDGIEISVQKKKVASFNEDSSISLFGDVTVKQDFILGDKVRYQQAFNANNSNVLIGYDLYIEE